MGKRKRKSKSQYREPEAVKESSSPFNNPFGGLSEIRDALPSAEPAVEQRSVEEKPKDLEDCGKLIVQCEKKGRAGKTITRISGLPVNRLDEISKKMKAALGCGATREGEDLLLLGSLVNRAMRWLSEEGAPKVVVSGGGQMLPKKLPPPPTPSASDHRLGPRSWRESTRRDDLEPGLLVDIVLKKDQGSGKLTRGIIEELLTRKPVHPRGIKVRLTDGRVGRVKTVIEG